MSSLLRAVAAAGLVAALAASAIAAGTGVESGRGNTLAVREAAGWVTWWRANSAPIRWHGDAPLASRIAWRPGVSGLEWGELELRGASEAWRTRVVVVRLDPKRVSLSLVPAFTRDRSWTVAGADTGAALALDAGQFRHALPWGWVVSQGRELLPPEFAPLAGAVIVGPSGQVRLVQPDKVGVERDRGGIREAFQSYPMLLQDGVVPAPLREPGRGVDVAHRDARLALGTLSDGRVVIALTRFDGLGPALGRVPFGLTSDEMAALMGALGCRDALALDGGISGQLLLRDARGSVRSWPGTRGVPLGLVGRPNR